MTRLMWPWVTAIVLLVLVGLLVAWARRRPPTGLLVAHTSRLTRLPRFRRLARREMAVAALTLTGALAVVVGAAILAGRPTQALTLEPERSGRDIELCLDVSKSMDEWNLQIVDSFEEIVGQLTGERVGLTIFSGAAVADIPLTDDYEYVRRQLQRAKRAFGDNAGFTFFAGVETLQRASLVSDGLVSCVDRIDTGDGERRGRAVVLASDNDPIGEPTFTFEEAAEVAIRNDVVVYGIGTPDLLDDQDRSREFERAVRMTGGTLSILEEDSEVDAVIEGIQQLEEERLKGRAAEARVDAPELAFGIATMGVALLLGAGLVGRRS